LGGPYTFYLNVPFGEPAIVDAGDLVVGKFYRATEIGGPPSYTGESDPSDPVELVA
jgi:hypothetical protein